MIQGITLIISPLLALSSDQMRNLKQRTADLPDVTCIHLDGMPEARIKIIADDISGMRHPITKLVKGALILFASPQFLTGALSQGSEKSPYYPKNNHILLRYCDIHHSVY